MRQRLSILGNPHRVLLRGTGVALALCALAIPSWAQTIDMAEYFIDVDPGPSGGTAIAITPGTSILKSVDIPAGTIAALTDGNHRLVCRVKDGEGNWSVAFARTFLKSPHPTFDDTTPDIVEGEYYIDSDSGPGEGTMFNVPGATSVDVSIDIPPATIADLPDGFHRLSTRVQDANGDWSSGYTRVFLKMEDPSPPPLAPLMERIDYRWLVDGDQVGDVHSLLPDPQARVIDFTELASLGGLQEGQTAVLEATPYDTLGARGVSAYATVEIETEDSDGDGVPDQWELFYGFNPEDDSDMALNSDDDDLTNKGEFLHGTNPLVGDTDGDEMNDSAEVLLAAFGFDPIVDNSDLRDDLYAAAVGAGLYGEQQIRDLNLRVPLIARDPITGDISVRFQVEQNSGLLLQDWSQLPLSPINTETESGDLLIEIPGEGADTYFIRVRASETLP